MLSVAGVLALGLYFSFAALVLVLRYAVLPQIENYRGDIEMALSRALNLPVAIRAIDAGWAGLRPRLAIHGLDIRDAQGRPGLELDEVRAELAWSSFLHGDLRLHRLDIVAPDLDVRRDRVGHVFIAGLEVGADGSEGGAAEWILAQDRIVVRDASIRWTDEQRGAPPLTLAHVNLDLQNDGNRHRFGVVAEPPPALAARLDLRADLRGSDLGKVEAWQGQAYAELDYADLAVWRAWLDYPVDLPRGSGAVRLWLDFADEQATGVTADIRLANVQLRFAPELPQLDLSRLEGRIKGVRHRDGYEFETRRLALATPGGIEVKPTDFHLRYRAATGGRGGSGEVQTSGLDLDALGALAAHLPLPGAARDSMATFVPRGRLMEFKLAWAAAAETLATWHVRGRFEDLGLAAVDGMPGFSGLTGSIDGDEKAGSFSLASGPSSLEFPSLFTEPRVPLDRLAAEARWKVDSGGVDIQLSRAEFANRDASGEASGHYYRHKAGGPGEIDLQARLTQGAGGRVWRYMPLVVSGNVREWLKTAIPAGTADEATLRLKGDLAKFPFADGKDGIFQVKGRFRDATLRYAAGWPRIDDVDGELLFEGKRMLIRGHGGKILGVGIGPVTAEIPDLASTEEQIVIEGRAAGKTADFLKFIDASPVAGYIDRFTEDMRAAGDGELRLRLDMPLRHLAQTKVDGHFRFINNQVMPDPDVPPLTDVNGDIHFTGERVEANRIRANLMGMPLTVDIAPTADGSIGVKAAGTLSMRTLGQQLGLPLFDSLSGSAPWNGTVKVRKRNAEVRIESSLQGIASALPEPFNKTTREAMPLLLERKQLPGGRSQLNASLGNALKATLLRRTDGDKPVVERGVIAVGTAARMPERGVLLAMQGKRLDLDLWRRLAGGNGRGESNGSGLGITQIELRADDFIAFGRSVAGLRLNATQAGGVWKAEVRSRDASGTLEWDGRGAGRISGHLFTLAVPEAAPGQKIASADMPDEMPAVDLTIDRCILQGKDLGAVKFKAENAKDGYWNAKFDVRNDDLTVDGTGRWRPEATAADTQVNFRLSTKSIERLLTRLGYPEAVRRGTANLEAALSWKGAPTAIDYASLDGNVKFEAFSGQFNKLEPGVGRLLGVLSLQSLPRRLTLDFRDIFSEGFAFDGIGGDARVTRGVMETKNLQIVGPAAKILMTGTVNLAAETQDLRVRVQPALGESIATGVLLVHPVTGAAAWVFNKIFGNPFDVAFSYEYAVTGSWADPKVEKLRGQPPAQEDKDKEGKEK